MKKQNTGEFELTGVVSASVDEERETDIRRSAAELERSVSWVVDRLMDVGWVEYFRLHPLRGQRKKAA